MARTRKHIAPRYTELMQSTLEALKQMGGSGTNEEIRDTVIKNLSLSDDKINEMHPGSSVQTELEYQLAWARTYLKKYGAISNSGRSVWSITPDFLQRDAIDPKEVERTVRNANRIGPTGNKAQEADDGNPEGEGVESEEIRPWRERLSKVLMNMDPYGFERLTQRLLRECGFSQVIVTRKTGDGGIDGTGKLKINGIFSFNVAFQCKIETCSSIYLASLTSRFDPQEVFRSLPIASTTSVNFGIPHFLGQPDKQREAFSLLTTSELSSMIALPVEDHPGIIVKQVPKFSVNAIHATSQSDIVLGRFCDRNVGIQNAVSFTPSDLTGHALVAGITGSGKSTTIRTILSQVKVPFLVFEPAKSEYRNLNINGEPIRVITAGDETVAPLRINPFEIADGDTLHSNIDALSATINAAFPMEGPMASLVEQGLLRAYKEVGWDTATGIAPDDFRVPTMNEFYSALERTIDEQKYEGEYGSNIKSALLTRINSLRIGPRGRLFNSEMPFDIKDLLSRPTVIEMKKIGSDETKAFLTGILLYRVYRYFESLSQSNGNSSLKSVLVIEEAHRLFRKTTENSVYSMHIKKTSSQYRKYALIRRFSTDLTYISLT